MTKGGYQITDFEELEHIEKFSIIKAKYKGNVYSPEYGQTEIFWDVHGRCNNVTRTDYFINLN